MLSKEDIILAMTILLIVLKDTEGTYLSMWITEDHKYQKVNDFEWEKWPAPFINALRVLSLIILIFGFFMLLIIINLRKTKESGPSILMRILANYLQIITSSLSMSTSYPDSLSDIFIPVKKLENYLILSFHLIASSPILKLKDPLIQVQSLNYFFHWSSLLL